MTTPGCPALNVSNTRLCFLDVPQRSIPQPDLPNIKVRKRALILVAEAGN